MSDIEIKVKIDGIEYTQDQLKDLAKGAKTAAKEVDEVKKETKRQRTNKVSSQRNSMKSKKSLVD